MNALQDNGEMMASDARGAQEAGTQEALDGASSAYAGTTCVLAVECSDEALAHLRVLCAGPARASGDFPVFELEQAALASEHERAAALVRGGARMCVVLGRASVLDTGRPHEHLLGFVREVSALGAPLIVLAEEECPDDDRALMEAGAVDYLVRAHINAALFERALRYAIERKKTESDLQEARDSLRVAQDRMARLAANAPGVVYQWKLEPDGHAWFTFLSEGATEVFGPRYADLLGRDVAPFINAHLHPDDRRSFWQSVRLSARDLSPWKWMGRIRRPADLMDANSSPSISVQVKDSQDGALENIENLDEIEEIEEIWLDCRARPTRHEDNSVMWDGMMLDCTARMRAEDALRRAHSDLEERVQKRTGELQERTQDLAMLNQALQDEIAERSRAEGEVRHRARQQEALAQLSQAALQGAEMPLLLRGAVSLVAATLGVEVAAIVRDDLQGHRLISGLAWSNDVGEEAQPLSASQRSESILQQVLDGAPTRVVSDWAALDAREMPALLHENGLRSSIYAPIPGESGVGNNSGIFGALIAHTVRPDAFSSDDVGFVDAMANVLATVIDRRRLEDALGQSQNRLQAILDNASNIIYIKDLDGRYVLANRQFQALHGQWHPDAPPLTGSLDADFLPPHAARALRAHDLQVLGEGGSHTFEEVIEHAGERLYVLSTKFPLFDESGTAIGLGGISTDITERKGFDIAREAARREAVAAREEAEHAREEADRANNAKSEFLSRMSHELRTPLNAILGFAQLLEISRLPERPAQGVRQILKAGRHLLALINEVLDIARIESGQLTTSLEPVPLRRVLEEVVELIEPLAHTGGVQLQIETAGACNCAVLADRQRLIQILLNLVSNAVKYNREGGHVHIHCSSVMPSISSNSSQARMRVVVSDSGAGISPERMARLWVPFDRLDAEKSGIEGTGLGLALSRALAQSMGGALHAESRVGEGSAFWIELQSASLPTLSPAPGAPPTGDERTARGTVLYIEDNLSNLHLLQEILAQRPGLRLLSARTGRDGLQIAQEQNPGLILLDLDLPDLHGLSVLEKLKQNLLTRQTPVLIVSADATDSQITRGLKAGAYGYSTKPLDVPRLLQVLDDVLTPDTSNNP